MYIFFRVVTRLPARKLTAPDVFLERAGFRRHARVEAEWSLLRSDWWFRADSSTAKARREVAASVQEKSEAARDGHEVQPDDNYLHFVQAARAFIVAWQ
jgi:hypothetical protein